MMSNSFESKTRPDRFRQLVLLCSASILINVTASYLASKLGSPLYLDSVGTILAAAVGGLVPGTITGFITNLLKGFWDLSSIYYVPINILLAFVTAFFAKRRDDFFHFPDLILPWVCLALTGGGIGSLLTWFLNGWTLSGAYAERLLELGLPPLLAQLLGDFGLDLIDKAITLLIVLPLGHYLSKQERAALALERLSLQSDGFTVRECSLRTKVMLIVMGLMAVVAISVSWITIKLYDNSVITESENLANSAARIAMGCFDPDRVPEYLELGEKAEGYLESEAALARVAASATDIEYVYIYQIREDGCHVVFDPDTAAGPGDNPGDVIDFDNAFMSVKDTLLKGGEIEPIISNEEFGWLLSVYHPVYDSKGVCQCYVGVDLSMKRLRTNEYVFQTQLISLFLGFTLLLGVLAIQLVDQTLLRPINRMAAATTAFARRSKDEPGQVLEEIKALDINTGDEIENLYRAISSTTSEVVQNMADIRAKNEQITRLQSGLIMVLADMVESRDQCTGNHVRNTASYVRLILNRLKKKGFFPELLTDDYINDVVSSAPLHDVGKIQVPDALLNKPGKLTDEEFDLMKKHTVAGAAIIDSAIEQVADKNSLYLNEAKKLTLYHHERWDGKGYPSGIKGEEIPLSARVMAVADVFDALVSRRSYKPGFPIEKALSIIREESGTHFDPIVVEAFLECEKEARAIAECASIQNAKTY